MSSVDYLAARVDGIVHEPTQVHEGGVDLTVADVFRVANAGRVDFGGGELEAPALEAHDRYRRNEDDDYEWWHLEGGQYLLSYNETLTGDEPVTLTTRRELLERGAFHPTVRVTELGHVPLAVPSGGIHVKENARVSTLTLPRRG